MLTLVEEGNKNYDKMIARRFSTILTVFLNFLLKMSLCQSYMEEEEEVDGHIRCLLGVVLLAVNSALRWRKTP